MKLLIFLLPCALLAQTVSSGPVVLDPFTSVLHNDMVSPDVTTLWQPGEPGECVAINPSGTPAGNITGGTLIYAAPNSGPTCQGQWVDGTNGYGMANLLYFPRGDSGGGTGGGAPNGWIYNSPCNRANNCEYMQGYAVTVPGGTDWTTLNRLYFTLNTDTSYPINPGGHTIVGDGAMEVGWYIRSHDNTATGNQGAHYYSYISTGIYTGFPLYVVLNRRYQHNNQGDGTDYYPEDPEWFACPPCYGQGQVSPVHVFDGETTMYVTAGPNAGGWTGNFTFSPWTLGTEAYREPDDWISQMTGTYTGSAYQVTWGQPKIVPGGVLYNVYYSSAGSMHVNGLTSGTNSGSFRGQDASNYTGIFWQSPNIAQATNMWVAIVPSIPIQAVTATSPITINTGSLTSGNVPAGVASLAVAPNRHWLQTGDQVTVANLCANANGTRTVTVIDNYTVSLGVSGACSYSGYTGTGSASMTATSNTQNFTEILIGPGTATVTTPAILLNGLIVGGGTLH